MGNPYDRRKFLKSYPGSFSFGIFAETDFERTISSAFLFQQRIDSEANIKLLEQALHCEGEGISLVLDRGFRGEHRRVGLAIPTVVVDDLDPCRNHRP